MPQYDAALSCKRSYIIILYPFRDAHTAARYIRPGWIVVP